MGDGLWPLFWVAITVVLAGGALYSSTVMMRVIEGVIDRRVERAKQEVLDELDGVEQRLARLEQETLAAVQSDESVGLLDRAGDPNGDG